MRANRKAARVDTNQSGIISRLLQIGASVEEDHDDIIVGYRGRSYWYEIKNPNKLKKNGEWQKGALRESQLELLKTFKGHYRVITTFEEIFEEITTRQSEK